MTTKNYFRILLVLAVCLCVFLFKYYGLQDYLNFERLKEQQELLHSYYLEHRVIFVLAYFTVYILSTALSLPGATILTLAGGAIFGFWLGLILVSFASSIGATLAFLSSRFLFKDWVESKFSNNLRAINDGLQKEGAFYLFTLRVIPLFPFFLINLVMGITQIKTSTFYWISQLGMLAGTAVYINAGTQIATIESASGIFSPRIIFSFALLGLFPLLAKKAIALLKSYRK